MKLMEHKNHHPRETDAKELAKSQLRNEIAR